MTPESIQSKTICNDVWILDREPVVINAINEVRKNCIQTKSFLLKIPFVTLGRVMLQLADEDY